MYMKIFLLCLLVLNFPDASLSCTDSTNYSWNNDKGESINCSFLTQSTDKQVKKQRLDKWCSRTVQGTSYRDKSEAVVKDKCPVACESCCESDCTDNTTFQWKDAGMNFQCSSPTTQARKDKFCFKMVQGLGDDYSDKECRVQSKCPKSCDNCCS